MKYSQKVDFLLYVNAHGSFCSTVAVILRKSSSVYVVYLSKDRFKITGLQCYNHTVFLYHLEN